MDILYTVLTLAFFALSWSFAAFCARLGSTDEPVS